MKLHTLIAAAFLASTAITPVLAASENIGGAAIVVNQVNGTLAAGKSVLVNQGDGIYREEVIRTNADSNTKIVLVDNTNLQIGPSSSVKMELAAAALARRLAAARGRRQLRRRFLHPWTRRRCRQ
jgi:hypothetical protein